MSACGFTRRHGACSSPLWDCDVLKATFVIVSGSWGSGNADAVISTSDLAAPAETSRDQPASRSRAAWLTSAAVVVAYVAIGISAFWPVYPRISDRLFSTKWNRFHSGALFLLSGAGYHGRVIAVATPALWGWSTRWDSASVANGTYSLQSVAYDSTGSSSRGPGVSVTDENDG
jgi:hypothetical protein